MGSIYNEIYNKLITLVPTLNELNTGESIKVVLNPGIMDLNLHVLNKRNYDTFITLSLYYKYQYSTDQKNDLMLPTPNIKIIIFPLTKMAEDLGYQDMYLYHCVPYDIKAKLEASLNDFLNSWLQHCLYQFERNKKNNE